MNNTNRRKLLVVLALILLVLISVSVVVFKSKSSVDSFEIYEAPLIKGHGELPTVNKLGGKEFISKILSAQPDLSDVELSVKIPSSLHDMSLFFENTKCELKSTRKSLPISIIPEESDVHEVTLSDGNIFRWGCLTGTITISGEKQELTIGYYELPSQKKASFSLLIKPGESNPPLAVTFGNLTPDNEMVEMVKKNSGGE